jgi:hypothetical protein
MLCHFLRHYHAVKRGNTAGRAGAVQMAGQRHATIKLSESFRRPQAQSVQSAWSVEAQWLDSRCAMAEAHIALQDLTKDRHDHNLPSESGVWCDDSHNAWSVLNCASSLAFCVAWPEIRLDMGAGRK